MIPKEILKKVRRIQIYTTRVVQDIFAGEYHSVFKGRGMEFEEVREYQVGDDVRSIDWNVTARTGLPHVKLFKEERELTVMLLADVSASGAFGTVGQLKSELIAELSAVLAFAAINNNDKIGLMLFTDRVEKYIPPQKGVTHVLRVIRELLYFKPEGRGTDISVALEFLSKVSTRQTVSFLVSDFIASGYDRALAIAAKRHDLIAVRVSDPRERVLPPVGIMEFEDPETGALLGVDTRDVRVRQSYAKATAAADVGLDAFMRGKGVDCIKVSTGAPYVGALLKFFKMRERRMAM
ncbi:MAG: DUF58 domain-containing protein [Candidatus Aureabacteria bacterium]|nr:DUF58 domain-containing protein [Candidatus Auribacterota bacterium]